MTLEPFDANHVCRWWHRLGLERAAGTRLTQLPARKKGMPAAAAGASDAVTSRATA